MPYVSVGRRFLAVAIDALISLAWTAPLAQVDHSFEQVGGQTVRMTNYTFSTVPTLIVIAVWITYYSVMEGAFGATVGKFAVGLRVVTTEGGKIGWQAALVRSVSRILDGFPWFIPYLLGAILVWTSPKKQRLGDRFAHTVVVKAGTQATLAAPAAPAIPPPVGGAPIPPPPPMPPMGS